MKKPIISMISALLGAAFGAIIVSKVAIDKKRRIQSLAEKHFSLFLMMNQWVKVKQSGKQLSSYFERNGYNRIAVYGLSYVGKTFIDELKNTRIEIAYGIDKNVDSTYAYVNVISLEDDLEPVDMVVVTAITFFDEIEEKLSERIDCPIMSLEDILYEM